MTTEAATATTVSETQGVASRGEIAHLRRELLLRMAIQNGTIMAAILLSAAFLLAIAAIPGRAGILALGSVVMTGALALQWCHCGVRIANLKAYLMARSISADLGWESWLPSARPRTLLGSRWLVSTKGVFLGTQIFVTGTALAAGGASAPAATLSAAGILGTAGFLFTNAKE